MGCFRKWLWGGCFWRRFFIRRDSRLFAYGTDEFFLTDSPSIFAQEVRYLQGLVKDFPRPLQVLLKSRLSSPPNIMFLLPHPILAASRNNVVELHKDGGAFAINCLKDSPPLFLPFLEFRMLVIDPAMFQDVDLILQPFESLPVFCSRHAQCLKALWPVKTMVT